MVTLVASWREHGLPRYAPFDNDTLFQGAHRWPDSFARLVRLCLRLGVMPVFTPPRETGFQAAIENYNGRWQAKGLFATQSVQQRDKPPASREPK